MKHTDDRDQHIFQLWNKENKTFAEIAAMKLPSYLSKKRIGNIVYGGKARLKTEHEKEIYRIFRLKFLELQNVAKAIQFAYENQPPCQLSEVQIRRIINKQLKKKR